MKPLIFSALILLLGCGPSREKEAQAEEENVAEDTEEIIPDTDDFMESEKIFWDYSELYGIYHHESNASGFSATLEIQPEGNDLTFSLSVKQQSCTGLAEGTIGMAVHSENEYAGFYDNPECRMEFYFNLNMKTIRIQEIGLCRLHESGCNFEGVYLRKP